MYNQTPMDQPDSQDNQLNQGISQEPQEIRQTQPSDKKNNKLIIWIILSLGSTVLLWFIWQQGFFSLNYRKNNLPQLPVSPAPMEKEVLRQQETQKIYLNESYGLQITYPENLKLTTEEGTEDGTHYLLAISLTDRALPAATIEIRNPNQKSAELEYQKWRLVGHLTDEIISEIKTGVSNYDAVALEYEVAGQREIKVIVFAENYIYTITGEKNLVAEIVSQMEIE